MATTSIAGDNMAISNGQPRKASEANGTSTTLPGYLTGPKKISDIQNTKSSLSNPYAARSEYLGEGGKQRSEIDNSENDPPGNTKDRYRPRRGGSVWAAVEGNRPKNGVAYNAWDNLGQIHSQYRASSQTTAQTGSAGLQSRPDAQILFSSFAKQTSAANRPSNTPHTQDTQSGPSGQAGGWAKQASFHL